MSAIDGVANPCSNIVVALSPRDDRVLVDTQTGESAADGALLVVPAERPGFVLYDKEFAETCWTAEPTAGGPAIMDRLE